MCHFISWIEHDGKNWFLTKNELNSTKGAELLEYCGCADDLVGHGAIRHYYGFSSGFDKELTDFSDPSRFPTEIVQALKDGLFEGVGLPIDILTEEARAKYNKIEQSAWAKYNKIQQSARAKYNKIEQSAWAKYNKIEQSARAKYNKIEQSAWAEYNKIVQPAWAEYNKIVQPAWAEYNKIRQSAWAEYEKIQQPAFWELFKDPNNRIEVWR